MLAMVRAAAPLLLLSAACAASVAPAATDAKSTEKLEALVRDMAKGQQEAAASAPTPKALDEDVMIFEGAERRRLGASDGSASHLRAARQPAAACPSSWHDLALTTCLPGYLQASSSARAVRSN